MVWYGLRCWVQLGAALACVGIPLGQSAEAHLSELEAEPEGLSVQQVWDVGENEAGDAGGRWRSNRCEQEACAISMLELQDRWVEPLTEPLSEPLTQPLTQPLTGPFTEPLLLAAPENLDPDLAAPRIPFFYYDASLLRLRLPPPSVDRGPNPLMPVPELLAPEVPVEPLPAIAAPQPAVQDSVAEEAPSVQEAEEPSEAIADSEPPRLKEPREPFFTLENIQLDLDDDFSNSGQGSGIFEPVFQGRLRDGTPVQFSTGFNVFDEPNIAKLINVPLKFGYEEEIEGIPVDIVGGIDFFDRLSPAPSFSTKATIPLGQKAVLSWALDYGPYKFNVETLENQISAFRYGPSLFWQIDEQTTLFSNVTWGRYSDSNREQQSFSRLERRFGEEFALAANLFNWRYRQDIGAASGYFTPGDFLVYSFEGAWEKPIFDFLKCRLAANLGRQHAGGAWSNAYGYDALCTVSLNRYLEADLGYSFSNTIDRDTGDSASNSREISSQVRMKF